MEQQWRRSEFDHFVQHAFSATGNALSNTVKLYRLAAEWNMGRHLTREQASKAVGDLKAMDMQVTEFSPAGSARTRDKLTRVCAGIGADVGMDLE